MVCPSRTEEEEEEERPTMHPSGATSSTAADAATTAVNPAGSSAKRKDRERGSGPTSQTNREPPSELDSSSERSSKMRTMHSFFTQTKERTEEEKEAAREKAARKSAITNSKGTEISSYFTVRSCVDGAVVLDSSFYHHWAFGSPAVAAGVAAA